MGGIRKAFWGLLVIIGSIYVSLTVAYADPIWPCESAFNVSTLYYYNSINNGGPHSTTYDHHNGLDINGGGNILACEAGTVISVKYLTTSYGHHVKIQHANGAISIYGHMSDIYVSEGQSVSSGQVIGVMGSTGNSTGTHLHFEYSNADPLQNYFIYSTSKITFDSSVYSANSKHSSSDTSSAWFVNFVDTRCSWDGSKYVFNNNIPITPVPPTPIPPCNCIDSYAGTYKCTSKSTLNIRSGHSTTSHSLGSIPSGAVVYVSKGDGTWAHVEYGGISGLAYMKYLQPIDPTPTPTPPPTHDYLFHVDLPSGTYTGNNNIEISGWLASNKAVSYAMYEIQNVAGSQNTLAISNEEEAKQGYSYGTRFRGAIDISKLSPNTTYTLKIWLGFADGSSTNIETTNFSTGDIIDPNAPFGSIDLIEGGNGTLRVAGWVKDNDAPDSAVSVHVYVGGPAGSGAEGYNITADVYRSDVGNHAFDKVINVTKASEIGTKDIYIYWINQGAGSNTIIVKQVTIEPANHPYGWFDICEGGNGTIFVKGWAKDNDDLDACLGVHVYVGGPAGVGEGHKITADYYRDDVGKHGFCETIAVNKTGQVDVYVYAINVGSGFENTLLGTKTVTVATADHAPYGSIDVVEGGNGTLRVAGWAKDNDAPDTATEVHVYIGGPAGSGAVGYNIKADGYRSDVGNHAFDKVINVTKASEVGTKDIYIYWINLGAGSHSRIVKQATIKAPNHPYGSFDICEGGKGTLRVAGWAKDNDDPDACLEVHVYVGGPAGARGVEGYNNIIANISRTDAGVGNHGFDRTIAVNKTGQVDVYVYAINVGSGFGNPLLGKKTVTILEATQGSTAPPTPTPTPTPTPEVTPTPMPGIVYDAILPEQLIILEEEAFAGSAFINVCVPDRIEEIQSRAFADCTELKTIYISPNVEYIADDAFEGVPEGLIIVGVEDSYAEYYAQWHGYIFEAAEG